MCDVVLRGVHRPKLEVEKSHLKFSTKRKLFAAAGGSSSSSSSSSSNNNNNRKSFFFVNFCVGSTSPLSIPIPIPIIPPPLQHAHQLVKSPCCIGLMYRVGRKFSSQDDCRKCLIRIPAFRWQKEFCKSDRNRSSCAKWKVVFRAFLSNCLETLLNV